MSPQFANNWELTGHYPLGAHYFVAEDIAELLQNAVDFLVDGDVGEDQVMSLDLNYDTENGQRTLTIFYDNLS